MSPRLPAVSGDKAILAFLKLGYEQVRQRGSHVRLRHPADPDHKPLTIPRHPTLKPGLLRSAIRDAGLTVEEFVGLL